MYLNMELPVFNYHSMERFAAVMTTVDLCNDTTAGGGGKLLFFLHIQSQKKKVEITPEQYQCFTLGPQ